MPVPAPSIISRHLQMRVLAATAALSLLLLLLSLSARMSGYVSSAAAGQMAPELVLPIMLYRLPEILELVIPLALFISVLFCHGQMQRHNEILAMQATGYGDGQLLRAISLAALVVALVMAMLGWQLVPRGQAAASAALQQAAQQRWQMPGRFLDLRGLGTIHISAADGDELQGIFMHSPGPPATVITAASARRHTDAAGHSWLTLSDGNRYQGAAGGAWQVLHFDQYRQALPPPERLAVADGGRAARHWRLAAPLMVLVAALAALAISRWPLWGYQPKILLAIMLYLLYLTALNSTRSAIEQGGSPLPFWGTHLAALALAAALWACGRAGR